jgi:hypothetical protein
MRNNFAVTARVIDRAGSTTAYHNDQNRDENLKPDSLKHNADSMLQGEKTL